MLEEGNPKTEHGIGGGGSSAELRDTALTTAERRLSWAQVLDPGTGFSSVFVKGKSHMSPSCTWESKWFILSLAEVHLGLKLITHAPTEMFSSIKWG